MTQDFVSNWFISMPRAEYDSLMSRLTEYQAERDEAREIAQMLFGRWRLLEYDFKNVRKENADFRSRLERWHAERDALRSSKNNWESQVIDLAGKLAILESENFQLRAEVEEVEKKNDALRAEVNKLWSDFDPLHTRRNTGG